MNSSPSKEAGCKDSLLMKENEELKVKVAKLENLLLDLQCEIEKMKTGEKLVEKKSHRKYCMNIIQTKKNWHVKPIGF